MKKFVIMAFATLLSTQTFAIETATNSLAYTLANTLYTAAIGVATSEASSLSISSKNQKAEALKIQNDAQNFYQSGIASLYLQNKMQMAKNLSSDLSDDEAVDLLVEASRILLAQ